MDESKQSSNVFIFAIIAVVAVVGIVAIYSSSIQRNSNMQKAIDSQLELSSDVAGQAYLYSTCTDSDATKNDGGRNYYVKGTVKWGKNSRTDICLDGTSLIEYFCNPYNDIGKEHRLCRQSSPTSITYTHCLGGHPERV